MRSQSHKVETKVYREKKQTKQTEIKCTFADCVGCFICKVKSKRLQSQDETGKGSRVEVKNSSGLITPEKSYAKALVASLNNKKKA